MEDYRTFIITQLTNLIPFVLLSKTGISPSVFNLDAQIKDAMELQKTCDQEVLQYWSNLYLQCTKTGNKVTGITREQFPVVRPK